MWPAADKGTEGSGRVVPDGALMNRVEEGALKALEDHPQEHQLPDEHEILHNAIELEKTRCVAFLWRVCITHGQATTPVVKAWIPS
jgi:hypothetical protein